MIKYSSEITIIESLLNLVKVHDILPNDMIYSRISKYSKYIEVGQVGENFSNNALNYISTES